MIRLSSLSRISGFLWHSSKWGGWFDSFLQDTSEIEVLACSLDTNLNHVTTMLQLRPSLNHWNFGCILKDQYCVTPAALSNGPKTLWQFSGKMHKFLRSLAENLAALVFLCCHYAWHIYYLLDSYFGCIKIYFKPI